MANVKQALGTASQAITCQVAPGGTGLVQGGAREATAIDNTSNLFLDALVYVAFKLQTGNPGAQKAINIYFAGSEDGTNYNDNATGSDAAITLRSPTQLRGPYVIPTPDSGALTYKAVIPVAQFFGGILPPKWSIIVENQTNITFDTTEGNHTKEYRGVFSTIA